MPHGPRTRLPAAARRSLLVTLAAACVVVPATTAGADLTGQIGANRAKDRSLQQQIGADTSHIQRFQRQIDDLQGRLDGLQRHLDTEQAQLASLQGRLRQARGLLVRLKFELTRDRRVLAAQLVSQYELPRPSLVNVVLQAHGFAELLEVADGLKAVAEQNAKIATTVKTERTLVGAQTVKLTGLEARQQVVTATAAAQRDAVAQVRLQLVNERYAYLNARYRKSTKLASLRAARGRLERKLAAYQQQQAAFLPAGTGAGLPTGGAPSFFNHGGAFGFFQAPGTNYSVGDEPRIAARLDVMGKALHLHLIGLSGYRSPQHSVEVGGFANDPHTRGQASDTPGLEGVPEATLNHYGLTRPFPGPAEADHVQLVGSI